MKEKVMKEIDRMLGLGVVIPGNEARECVSAMVASIKKDASDRLCMNPVHLKKGHTTMKLQNSLVQEWSALLMKNVDSGKFLSMRNILN